MLSILSTLIEKDENLFKMIEDCGGFKRFDMDCKPNYKIIDVEKEEQEKMEFQRMQRELEDMKAKNMEDQISHSATVEFEGNEESSSSDNINITANEEEDMDRNVDGFG